MAQREDEYEYEIHDGFVGTTGPPDCAIVCRPATSWEAWAEAPEPLQDSDKQRALVKVHRSRLLAIPLYNSTMVPGAFDTKGEVIIEGLPVIHFVPHAANDLCIILGMAYNDLSKIDELDNFNRFQLWQLWQACNFYQMYVLRHSISMLLRPSLSDVQAAQAIRIHCAARDLHDGKLAAAAFERLMQWSLPQLNDTGLLRNLDDTHFKTLITRQLKDLVTEVDGIARSLESSNSMLLRQNFRAFETDQIIKVHCAARDRHDVKLAAATFANLRQIRLPKLSKTLLLRRLDDAHLDTVVQGQFHEIRRQLENITHRVRHLEITPNTQSSRERAEIIVSLNGLAASVG